MDTKWEVKLPPAYKAVPASHYNGVLLPSPIDNEPIEFEKSHYAIFLTPRSPRMEYGIQLTRFLLDSIQQLCKVNNAGFSVFFALNDQEIAMPDSSYSVEKGGMVYTLNKSMFFNNVQDIMRGYDFHLFRLETDWKEISRQDNHHFNHEAQQEIARKIVEQILLPDMK